MSRRNHLAGCVLAAIAAMSLINSARGQSLILDDKYHAQTAAYTCATASLEMQLDLPLITNNNAFVQNLLATGDGNYVALNAAPTPNTAQSYLYYMVHANNAGTIANNVAYNNLVGQANLNQNQFFYNNPFINPVPGSGGDLNSIQFAANVVDNPAVAGLGNDAYTSFNVGSVYQASRTIANAMQDTKIPAIIAVNSGTHAISVYGVNTSGVPGKNQQYTINGFFVHDPWSGYVQNAPNLPAAIKKIKGIGINTYLRYGYDKPIPQAPQLTAPDGTQATPSKLTWFNFFNLSGGQPATAAQLYQTGPGYKFQVEPQGPESLDDGTFSSLPAAAPLLPSQLTQSGADSDASPDLATDGLTTEPGFENGSWDTTDTTLIQDPSDPTVQGDWLVPYDGLGGTDDITGMIAIDEDTGVIDMATWFDSSDPIQFDSLADMDQTFTDDLDGILPDGNPDVPEPASIALIAPAAALLLNRRRRANKAL